MVFAVLYLAHHPLFWGTMAWVTLRVRRQRPIVPHAALGAFFWFMPYLYVLAFGRGLSPWIYAALAAVVAVGGTHAVREIRKRIGTTPRTVPDGD